MKIEPGVKPPVGGMGGSIHDWERSIDPWRRVFLPEDERRKGWMAVDAWGNPVMFVADGETIEL